MSLGDDAKVQTTGDQERPASLRGGHAALELSGPNVPCETSVEWSSKNEKSIRNREKRHRKKMDIRNHAFDYKHQEDIQLMREFQVREAILFVLCVQHEVAPEVFFCETILQTPEFFGSFVNSPSTANLLFGALNR